MFALCYFDVSVSLEVVQSHLGEFYFLAERKGGRPSGPFLAQGRCHLDKVPSSCWEAQDNFLLLLVKFPQGPWHGAMFMIRNSNPVAKMIGQTSRWSRNGNLEWKIRLSQAVKINFGTFEEANNGCVFTSGFLGRLASDNRKSRENSYFSNSLKVKRVGKLQQNSH